MYRHVIAYTVTDSSAICVAYCSSECIAYCGTYDSTVSIAYSSADAIAYSSTQRSSYAHTERCADVFSVLCCIGERNFRAEWGIASVFQCEPDGLRAGIR